MSTGIDERFVGIDPNAGGHWSFIVRSESDRIADVIPEFVTLYTRAVAACESVFRPVEVEYALRRYTSDGPVSVATNPDPDADPAFLGSDRRRRTDESSVTTLPTEFDEDGVAYLGTVEVVRARTRVSLAEFDGWIDRTDRGRLKQLRSGEVIDAIPDADPLALRVVHRDGSGVPGVETAYKFSFDTQTDLWFRDTAVGRRNRQRLADCFARLVEALPVVEVWTDSEVHGEATMRSVLPE
jgi:hypothetical protein